MKVKLKKNTFLLCRFHCHFKRTIYTKVCLQSLSFPSSWTKPNSNQSWERPDLQPGNVKYLYCYVSLLEALKAFSQQMFFCKWHHKWAYICDRPWKQRRVCLFRNTMCSTQKRHGSGFSTSVHTVSLPRKEKWSILNDYLQGAGLKYFFLHVVKTRQQVSGKNTPRNCF